MHRVADRLFLVLFYLFEHDNLLLFRTCGDTAKQKDYIRRAPLRGPSRVCGVVVCAETRALHDFDDHCGHLSCSNHFLPPCVPRKWMVRPLGHIILAWWLL